MKIDFKKSYIALALFAVVCFLFYGNVLDTIANTSIITPSVTYCLSILSVVGFAVCYYLKKKPVTDGEGKEIEGFHSQFAVGIVVLLIVLWIPRFNEWDWRVSEKENQSNSILRLRSGKDDSAETSENGITDSEALRKTILVKDYFPKSKGKLRIRFRLFFTRVAAEPSVELNKIEVYMNSSKQPLQTIEISKKDFIFGMSLMNFKNDDDGRIVVEDLNFDGFDDFRFLTDTGSGGDSYECYLYDKGNESFINSKPFDLIFQHNAVKLNKIKKEIEVARECETKFETKTSIYRVVGYDELELLSETDCEEYINRYVESD